MRRMGFLMRPGTQVGDMPLSALRPASECKTCHGDFDPANEPYATWAGSLMALGGHDPLFFAQMTTANQDVANVGSFCLRCHVPAAVVTGHVANPSGSSLDARISDRIATFELAVGAARARTTRPRTNCWSRHFCVRLSCAAPAMTSAMSRPPSCRMGAIATTW